MPKPTLTDLIQVHERKWGETQYPGRPTLDQLLNGSVIAMWVIGKRFVFTVHKDAQELNELLFNLVTGKVPNPEQRTLARLFISRVEQDYRIAIVPRKQRPPTKPHAEHANTESPIKPLKRQPEIVPLAHQPKLEPLPPQPNKRYGQNLPGRHVTLLPGRKVKLRKGNDN